ncbi:MAG: uncharacterized protein KVP18_002039 [Porospora cf. gigantea A]|uniref:uncharacterized protein n=2 Tax=Porospora cf. gigantea A TaxID=2853593 RepID=UPI003559809E|nr:MAG: hypothetical protein KVP18_002039 [Porospora cf. gigantea A]
MTCVCVDTCVCPVRTSTTMTDVEEALFRRPIVPPSLVDRATRFSRQIHPFSLLDVAEWDSTQEALCRDAAQRFMTTDVYTKLTSDAQTLDTLLLAQRTCACYCDLVREDSIRTTGHLIRVIQLVAEQLIRSNKEEYLLCTCSQRILSIVRIEHRGVTDALFRKKTAQPLHNWNPSLTTYFDYCCREDQYLVVFTAEEKARFVENVLLGIAKFQEEIFNPWHELEGTMLELFTFSRTVLIHGFNDGVLKLLRKVKRKRKEVQQKMTVLLVCSDSNEHSDAMRSSLLRDGIDVTCIHASALAVIMPYVDRVLLGPEALLSTGGALVVSGGGAIASMAMAFAKPLLAITALHQFVFMPTVRPETSFSCVDPDRLPSVYAVPGLPPVSAPTNDFVPAEAIHAVLSPVGVLHPTALSSICLQRYYPDDLFLSAILLER